MVHGSYRGFPRQSPFTFPVSYSPEDHARLSSGMLRADSRSYPLGDPNTDPRGRRPARRDEDGSDAPRRRISVACARCRKRKIRCSGDPGNGTGCLNCRSAGVDYHICQFHRVGSTEALAAYAQHVAISARFASVPSTPISPNTIVSSFPANLTQLGTVPDSHYPQLDTKPIFPQSWNLPYSDAASPVETYNLDQPTAYMPDQNTIAAVYGQGYRWHQASQKASQAKFYEQDSSSTCNSNGLPYAQTSGVSVCAPAEASSPLNMTSIQSALPVSLPDRPHPRQAPGYETTAPQRQLPMPQPSPAQATKNVVDQLQDQRLRSVTVVGTSSTNMIGSYKPLAWPMGGDGLGNRDHPTSEPSNLDCTPQATTSAPSPTSINDTTIGFSPVLPSDTKGSSITTTQPIFNFNTAPLLEPMSMGTPTVSYSNFRSCPIPAPAPSSSTSDFLRQYCQTNSYELNTPSKMNSINESELGGTLVSGQRYTPLQQPQSGRNADYRTASTPSHQDSMTELSRRLQ